MTPRLEIIRPDWPAPSRVVAFTTTRRGGCSKSPFDSLNLANHVDDAEDSVRENRHRLAQACDLPAPPFWLDQVHSTEVVVADRKTSSPRGDASITREKALPCAVLTADCLPVLLCDREGLEVAAVHAGWRGLVGGIVEKSVARMRSKPANLLAWLGPAIGPDAFEVGDEVREAFLHQNDRATTAFVRSPAGRWLANLPLLAEQRLLALGVECVCYSRLCTYSDPGRFFSYRRDGPCGRLATVIWIGAS